MKFLPFECHAAKNTVQYKVPGLHKEIADSSSLVECGTVFECAVPDIRIVVSSSSGSGCPQYTTGQYNSVVMYFHTL
jgi:hypothetical protein